MFNKFHVSCIVIVISLFLCQSGVCIGLRQQNPVMTHRMECLMKKKIAVLQTLTPMTSNQTAAMKVP